MGVSLVIDDATLLLMLLIILALVFTIYTARSFQPLLHPLILTRQADVARVRHHGESAVFRNANSPPGFELAGRPRRGAESVGKMLELGSATSAVTGSFGAGRTPNEAGSVQFTLFGQSSSTASLIASAKRFASGLQALTASKELSVVVCTDNDSVAAATVLLAPAVKSTVSLQVIPPSAIHTAREALPSTAKLRAVFTAAEHLEQVLGWKLLEADVLICLPSSEELSNAKEVVGSGAYKLLSIEQVLKAGNEEADAQSATLDSLYAHYWSDAWVPVTHGNLAAGVTAHLGAFSADKIPTRNDRISLRCPPVGFSAVKDLLSPVSTPAGLAILLLACYTGASLSLGDEDEATMLYTSPLLAAELADWLAALSAKAPLSLGLYATRSKLYALRQGVLANDTIWDRIHFNRIREEAGVKQLRSISIIDESGRQAGQNTIDTLRAFTGGTVMHAYLPSAARTEDSHAVALFTAPISSSHAADLQAFDDGASAPYHVGPPSVSVEMKLLETEESKRKGYSVETLSKGSEIEQSLSRWPRDPAGTLLIRGKTVATKESQAWVTSNAIAAFRTNGTLVLVDTPEASEVVQTAALGSARSRALKGSSRRSAVGRAAALSIMMLSLIGQASAAGGPPNGTMINVARAGLLSAQRPSWVQGAAAAAFIELDASSNWNYFSGANNGPVYRTNNSNPNADGLPRDVSNMAYHAVAAQDSAGRLCSRITGEESLEDSSSLDSSSCAVQVLLTGVSTGQIAPNRVGSGFYADAANRQLNFVLQRTNRTRAGAISQRNGDLQIWSDSMYMISCLAVYGLVYNNQSLLQEAYNQLGLYRQALLQPSGRYTHIWDATNSTWLDGSEWVTGNGWAAAGMLRTLACIAQSSFSDSMLEQKTDLFTWSSQLLDSVYPAADADTGLFHNHINDTNSFIDASGSILIAYSTFRLASMAMNSSQHVDAAEKIYQTVSSSLDQFGHFNRALTTVDALAFNIAGPTSPEALSFVLLLGAARRDYAERNVTGIYGPGTANRAPPVMSGGMLVAGPIVNAAVPLARLSALVILLFAASALIAVLFQ